MHCGLDFGTSNSTLGICGDSGAKLLPLEGGKPTLPSAIFYSFEDNQTYVGRAAIDEYVDGADGRLMRALKSVLGTRLINDTTQVRTKALKFTDIIGTFVGRMKAVGEQAAGVELGRVVVGRPVHFVDDDAVADAAAQGQLEAIVRAQGFGEVEFQYEPIAAALDYERQVRVEKLALIVDIGGGTSDFSVVRVSPERARAADRSADILANAGVHLGGTDVDRLLSMARVMPKLGYGSWLANGKMEVPAAYYFDLATWQRINRLYARSVTNELEQVAYEAAQPELIKRLLDVVAHRLGHKLAGHVEAAKIALTDADAAEIMLRDIELSVPVTLAEFNGAIGDAAARIAATVTEVLRQAGVTAHEIEAVFLTGGSTQIPLVKRTLLALVPAAEVVEGDMFGSVGLGLALDARRKFG